MSNRKIGSGGVLLLTVLMVLALSGESAFAQTITQWTFENDSIATNNNPAPSTGSGTVTPLGMSSFATPGIGVTACDVLQGASGDTGANTVADLTHVFRVRATGAGNGWSSAAPIGTQGAQFGASTVGYTNISVSFDWYATNQGEGNLQLQYTTDGTTWNNVAITLGGSDGGLAVNTNSVSANTVIGSYVSCSPGGQGWFTGLTATISNPAANNNANFAIRMVNASTGADCINTLGGALNNTSGNWRFDNVTISGTGQFSISNFSGNIIYPAGQQTVTVAPTASISTVDTNFNGGNLTLTFTANGAAEDQLGITLGGPFNIGLAGSTVTSNGNNIGTLSGGTSGTPLVISFTSTTTTPAVVQALLQGITYKDTAALGAATLSVRTLQATLNDGTFTTAPVTETITVTSIPPVIGPFGANISYNATGGLFPVTTTATVTDADSSNFNGGSLSVSFTANGQTEDQLAITNQGNGAGQIGVAGTTVSFGGNPIGTITANGVNGAALTVNFNTTNATPAAAQALLLAITYQDVLKYIANTSVRTVQAVVNDGSSSSIAVTKTITVVNPFTAQVAITPGNLLITRSVYTGIASSVIVGSALPGGGIANSDGTYPGIFNNESQDASFGITSPILIDQVTTAGAPVSTTLVPPSQVTTSFPSKSEIGLNQSSDGKYITFMAYVSGANTLDVSNANTPNHVDPTNPVALVRQRAVVQFDLLGNFQVTPTNAYSGNNGRNAILVNGNYYMTGNAGNGSGNGAQLSMLSDDTGVQMIAPGIGGDTTVVGLVRGTNGSATGYQRGFSITDINPLTGLPYAGAVDKTGKDDNFRGLTLFNNTLYCTKGSGSNGINTVYQVGTAGTLPTFGTAGATPITVLPGLPTGLAKTTPPPTLRYPFGIWFANATTLYVCDEGAPFDHTLGTLPPPADAMAGLQKWMLVNGIWTLQYTLQNGLNLGTPFAVPNGPNGEVYPTGVNAATGAVWTPANSGLRNIAGKINGDGTVTIYASTSTVSGATDQGADPNQVVAITDNLSFTTAGQAAGESFTVIKQAVYGEVLRGVVFVQPSAAQITFDAVAAGDVTSTDVILLTHVSPAVPVNVTVQLATDPAFQNIVLTSNGNTDPSKDFTAKLNPTGLTPGTRYYYRFTGPFGTTSNTGTFKTAYAAGTKSAVHFAFSGDCDGRWRPFPSVNDIGSQALDFFEFCGDCTYENASSPATSVAPASPAVTAPDVNLAQSLIDLRRKYRENITLVNAGGASSLRNFFAAQANYTLLDNHELCSNVGGNAKGSGPYQCGGAPNPDPLVGPAGSLYDPTNVANDINLAGPFTNKTPEFLTCVRAFSNYEPIREHIVSAPTDPRTDGTQQLFNSQQWGKNLLFVNTDDRSYADQRLLKPGKVDDNGVRGDNPQRTRFGTTQLAWLEQLLLNAQAAGTPWKVVTVSDPIDQIGPIRGALSGDSPNLTNTDGGKSWSGGYRAERNALMKFIVDNKITNVVFLATDDHTNRVNELLYMPNPAADPTIPANYAYVPTCFSIVAGPMGASGPENFTDHTIATLNGLANGYASAQRNVGVNPCGLDPAFPGLHDVFREGDANADTVRQPFDFFSPDTENYETLDISADGKTLTVTTWGINSYNPNLFLEASTTGAVRKILSFSVDVNPPAVVSCSASPASGEVNTAIPLTINAALTNPQFPQTLTVQIGNVPLTSTLSAGVTSNGNLWTLTAAQLAGLKITSTATGSANLSITATDYDGSNLPIATLGASNCPPMAIGTATATLAVNFTPHAPPVASNGTLSVHLTTLGSGTLISTNPDSLPLTFSIVTAAGKGTATVTNPATGAFTYKANAGATGTDTFTFKVNDGIIDSNIATVTVTITDTAPVAMNGNLIATGTTAATGTLVAFDADGDALTYSIVANGTKGTAKITNAATGAFTYTANANTFATDSFTFSVSDGALTSNIATISVTIMEQNIAPTAVISVSTGPFSVPASVGFDGTASAPNVVAWEWDFGDGAKGSGSTTSHTYIAAGTYTVTLKVINAFGTASTPATATVVIGPPPALPATTLSGKFAKSGKVSGTLTVTLPTGSAPASSIAVTIGTFSDTFVQKGKTLKGKSGTARVSGQTITFPLKTTATALFGSPAPTTGSKSVSMTVQGILYSKTVTFTAKGSTTSFQ